MSARKDDYDKVVEVRCQQCHKVYEILLVADFVGYDQIMCGCSAMYMIEQHEGGRVCITHVFMFRTKPKLRIVRNDAPKPKIRTRSKRSKS